jgi:synaptotagmin-1
LVGEFSFDLHGETNRIFDLTEPDGTEEAATESTMTKIKDKGIHVADVMTDFVAEKSGMPRWGVVAIFILIALIILGICGFCIRRCFRKRRSKDGKKGMKGVDLKSVQLLGSATMKVNIIMSMSVWLLNNEHNEKLL